MIRRSLNQRFRELRLPFFVPLKQIEKNDIISVSKRENGDWELFGLCCITDWEFGSVFLSDLESIEFPWGSGIERDRYAHGTIGELAAELGYYSYDDYEVEDEPIYNTEEEER